MGADAFRPSRPRKIAREASRTISDPREALEKVKERIAKRREKLVRRSQDTPYAADADWEQHVHELIGAPWPCEVATEFARVWSDILETMRSKGFRVGRRNYGDDDDADPGLGRALWCLVRHLRPERVVETGVAHGVSSRCILEALDRNQAGRLWSIDLPPLTIPERRSEIAVAVPDSRRGRWTYIEGSSRRKLPGLLRELGEIQLFLHDSWHSTRSTRWELERAWSALTAGGVVMADDIDHNWGFDLFTRRLRGQDIFNCAADDGQRVFGIARKEPLPKTGSANGSATAPNL
jgi:predicted O-methyltransferase YrrM